MGSGGLSVHHTSPTAAMQMRAASSPNQEDGFCAGVTTRGRDTGDLPQGRGAPRLCVAQSPLLIS